MRRIAFSVFVLMVSFACAAVAHAQVSVYATWANARITDVPSTTGTTTQQQTYWASGIGGGVTVNILPLPVVSLGVDLRGSTRSGANGADTALGGLKLGVHPPALPLKLYIQGSVGYVGLRPASGVTNKYGAWEILGGVDYPLIHFVDFRVIEVGAGRTFLHTTTNNSPSLLTINTGLVLHF
ncbi:MAG TPA: hypothetical protein VN678_06750 [Acidobacteriaceae bacterium]|nr:hypothetical protein [Acidobacteriaceae bacterium]